MQLDSALRRWLRTAGLGFSDVQRRWAAAYIKGLLLTSGRKSIARLAKRVARGHAPELHHFVAESPWDEERIERRLAIRFLRNHPSSKVHVVLRDVPHKKKGERSVGIALQRCGGSRVLRCQCFVTVTLVGPMARSAVPVAWRLFVPRRSRGGRRLTTSDEERACRARGRLALSLAADRVSARSKVTLVVGAEYGESATFLHAVRRGWRRWLVQVSGNLVVRRVEDDASLAASDVFAKSSRVQIWRERALALTASAVRVRLTGDHLRVWLVRVQQRRTTSIFLTTLPVRGSAFKDAIRALLTATWMDQRLRKEVGIADYEVRGARGTAHHVAMAEAALAFMDECGLGED